MRGPLEACLCLLVVSSSFCASKKTKCKNGEQFLHFAVTQNFEKILSSLLYFGLRRC